MARFLVFLGISILLVGLFWPYLTRLGLGNLPGDIVIRRERSVFYFPITTMIVCSLALSLIINIIIRLIK